MELMSVAGAMITLGAVLGITGVDPVAPPPAVAASRQALIADARSQGAAIGSGPAAPGKGVGGTTDIGELRQVHQWSKSFLSGQRTSEPLVALDEWITPLLNGDVPVGTERVALTDGKASPNGGSTNADLARALVAAPDGLLVEDPTIAAYYVLSGDTVTAVNGNAVTDVASRSAGLDAVQRIVHARYSAAASAAEGVDAAVGGGGPLATGSAPDAPEGALHWRAAVVAMAAVCGGVALLLRRRRPRTM